MADPANTGIYEIVNSVTGKRYIGSSINLRRRKLQHFYYLRKGKHHNAHLQNAWNYYGAESFEFRVILYCDRSQLVAKEQDEFERLRPEYNLAPTAGNLLGFKFPESALMKIRGRKRNPESVALTAAAHRGMKRSEETRCKISKAATGSKKAPRSQEYRSKLSAALKGKPKSADHMEKLQAGRAARVYSQDQRDRISVSMRKAYAEGRISRERPPEYKAKISASLTGRTLTAEHRSNVAASMRGKKRGPYKRSTPLE